MGTKRATLDKKVSELVQKTKLSKPVVQNLMQQYSVLCSIDRGAERDKAQERENVKDALMDSFGIRDIFLLDRIYRTFNTANSHHLTQDDFVIGMGSFLSGDLDEQTTFCFKVYDVNGDGYLSKDEMYQFLKDSMVTKSHDLDQDDGEEGIKELTDMVLKMLDHDHDGRVSFADFRTAVDKNKLHLQILGKCLPDEGCRCDGLRMLGEPDLSIRPTTISSKKQAKKAKKAQAAQRKY